MNLVRETNRLCRTDCAHVRKRRLRGSGQVVRAEQPELGFSGVVGTADNKGFWGKKREAAWQCRLRDHGGESDVPRVVDKAEDGSLIFLVHPVAHLAWTSLRRKGSGGQSAAAQAPDGSMQDHGPPVCDFGVANSAMCTMALPVNWAEVEQLAAAMEASPSAPAIGPAAAQTSRPHAAQIIAEVFRQPENGWWQVVDKKSLQPVLAHALLDKPVVVKCLGSNNSKDFLGVELDRTKLWCEDDDLLEGVTDGAAAIKSSAAAIDSLITSNLHNFEEPYEIISKAVSDMRKGPGSSSKVLCGCDPAEVAHTRWAEACCWPKVWALRQVLVDHGDQAWDQTLTDQGIGLGSVPIKWSAERSSWTAGNRHRVVASLLTGQRFQATFKRKQVVQWEWREEQGQDSGPSRTVKWPSKLWQPKLTEM